MGKVKSSTKTTSQTSRFDSEALGLVLFALGIFILVTVFLPSLSSSNSNQSLGIMAIARYQVLLWLGWGAYLLPLIPLCYGVLIFIGRNVKNLSRRVIGGIIVVITVMCGHELYQSNAAGELAHLTMNPLFKTIGYLVVLPLVVLFSVGLEIMLSLLPLTMLKSAFRWISQLLGGATINMQGVIESRQDDPETAQLRAQLRQGFTSLGRDLDMLRRWYPNDDILQDQTNLVKQAQRGLRSKDAEELGLLARDLDAWQGMHHTFIADAARDLQNEIKAEALDSGTEAEELMAEVSTGRNELSIALSSTLASGELELVRRRFMQDLQHLAWRAGRLERERKTAEDALNQPDVAMLGRERQAHEQRLIGWQEFHTDYLAWREHEQHYPGWPDLAATYDRAPTEIAAMLSQAFRNDWAAVLSNKDEWRQRLTEARNNVLKSAEMIDYHEPETENHPPTMDFEFDVALPKTNTLPSTDTHPTPARTVAPAANSRKTQVLDGPKTQLIPTRKTKTLRPKGQTQPIALLEDLEPVETAPLPPTETRNQPIATAEADLIDDWGDEEDMPFGPPSKHVKAIRGQSNTLKTPPEPLPPPSKPSQSKSRQITIDLSDLPESPSDTIPSQSNPPILGNEAQVKASTPKASKPPTFAPWEEDENKADKPKPAPSNPTATKPMAIPQMALLDPLPTSSYAQNLELDNAAAERKQIIDETLGQFKLEAKVIDHARGPTVTRYEIEPGKGEKISRIASLSNDLALALAVGGVRIEAPIPGKKMIGLEVPNAEREPVTFHQAAEAKHFKNARAKLPVILGKSIDGELMVGDLAKMPHLLVAGSTGSGKSVCVNTLITSLLYKYMPTELRFLMIDPKMVELTPYDGIPHLVRDVVTNPMDAAGILLGAVAHMERRYKMMSQVGAKNLEQFNAKMRQQGETELPRLVIIIDELADLMITSPKEVESAIMRLAQMARATGMHLILATQRPSVDILTSLIKVNIPARIAFAVSSSHDSRTILDSVGAERLTGMGDMLFYQPGQVKPVRLQGPYISEKETERITAELREQIFEDDFVAAYGADFAGEIEASGPSKAGKKDFSDPLLHEAATICVDEGQGSVSRLQRRLSVGHARAGKLMDMLEAMGIVSKHQGSKPREVLINSSELPEYFGK